jgi:hypothetical protein
MNAARGPARAEKCSASAAGAPDSMSTTPHPHFDDRGTLSWHTRWRDALAEARASQRPIFVELGREL